VTRLTIDGRALEVAEGTSVLEAALAAGIDVPRLCHHPELTPAGSCRLCMVEVDGRPGPAASCGLTCGEGMVVRTHGERLHALRRDLLDLLVSDHPLTCVTCDKNGACDLQRICYEHGVSGTSYGAELSRPLVQDDNPFFVRDHRYCILCGKCARVCDEVVGAGAIDEAGRGFTSRIATPFDAPLADSACVFCGSCVQVCPTAALLPKLRLGQGREWELERRRTVCGYCGVGCGVEYALKDGRILYARGFTAAPANGEFLCVKGRFGWDFATSPDRLRQPLVRREVAKAAGLAVAMGEGLVPKGGDAFVPVAWDDALDLVADRLAAAVRAHGPDAVAGLASARCTNEENYLFQKLVRRSLGTNNVDHCARLCHASSVTGLGMAFGSGAMTNPIRDVRDADCVLITGSNTAESHPVIGYEVVRAVKRGASLVVIDPRRVPLCDHAALFLQPRPGTDGHVFLAMAHVVVREGWLDRAFVEARTEGYGELAASLAPHTPEAAELASGVPAADVARAARLYALGERADGNVPDGRGRSTLLYAMGITQRSNGTDLVLMLANLALLCGQVGKPATGVNPLRGQSNVQGACDVGALPNLLPGYRPVAERPGLTVVEMTAAAAEGRLRAMYVMGENPVLSDPDQAHVVKALEALDFLVVQDIFLSETAQLADVVLPAAAWLEKDGTMTSTERRVQLLRPVLDPPGEALPDWRIVCALARRLDARLGHTDGRWEYADTSAVMDELAGEASIYGGVSHARLNGPGLVWPCPSPDHPGTPRLHAETFTRGRGKLHAVAPGGPAEPTDAEYPLVLTTGRILYQYHTGTMTRRSAGLDWREPRGFAEVSAVDAAAVGVRDGGNVVIRSRRGAVRTQARVSRRVPPGTVFLSFHWKESPANALTHDFGLDPRAKIPELKVCAVRLENPKGGPPAA
jgi:formate dehydrogenase alpha subunit